MVPTPANHSTTAEWSGASPHDEEDRGLLSLFVVAKKRALAEHKSEESQFCCTEPEWRHEGSRNGERAGVQSAAT